MLMTIVRFLRDASCLGRFVLVNLPLEDVLLNKFRNYGPNDVSGHLRKYTLNQGLNMFQSAGLKVINYNQVWIYDSVVHHKPRQLRQHFLGTEYNGGLAIRTLKRSVIYACSAIPPLGRYLFSSNLFAIAQKVSNT